MAKINGKALRKLREERGLSLRAFAEKIYVSKSSVQSWEKSYLPEDDDVLESIAQVLGVSVDDMCKISEKLDSEEEERVVSPEKLAEIKFGTKGLAIAFAVLGTALFIGIFMPFIILF